MQFADATTAECRVSCLNAQFSELSASSVQLALVAWLFNLSQDTLLAAVSGSALSGILNATG